MRAKVAISAGGHPFEKRFMDMDHLQLSIAYRYALKTDEEKFNLVKTINDVWGKKIENLFELLYVFVDRESYKFLQEAKKLAEYEEELKPEDFPELWAEMMEVVPQEIIAEENVVDPLSNVPMVDEETNEFLTGFVPYKTLLAMREGEKDANE